ncbi:MAG TPA: MBL fold metallo-hydrolase [Bacilli bacterium]|nr:MBL fold metallo-hydrolase [Bacilli bacterium]
MQLGNGIEMLNIQLTTMGRQDTIHPTLLWDENSAVLVDAGYPGQLGLFQAAMEEAGVPFDRLNRIVMTHQDIDHIGCLPDLVEAASQPVEVLANEIEKPYIQGDKRLIKLSPEIVEKIKANMPADTPQEWREAFLAILDNPPQANVDTVVEDGQELPYAGGVIVVNTPGHTPGHISLYHKATKTLIAGDALFVVEGALIGPPPQFTLDVPQAMASLKKLTEYDIQQVICYHGGLYNDNVNERIAELAQG